MKIAILGWGSLIWDPRDLALAENQWHPDGPRLPLEFARISGEGQGPQRLTLVMCDGVPAVRTFWARSAFDDLDRARMNLASREGTSVEQIGYVAGDPQLPLMERSRFTALVEGVSAHGLRTRNEVDLERRTEELLVDIDQWRTERGFDAVIWTDLPSNFEDRARDVVGEGTLLTPYGAVQYLNALIRADGATAAEEYIRRTPSDTRTDIRDYVESALGWVPLSTSDQLGFRSAGVPRDEGLMSPGSTPTRIIAGIVPVLQLAIVAGFASVLARHKILADFQLSSVDSLAFASLLLLAGFTLLPLSPVITRLIEGVGWPPILNRALVARQVRRRAISQIQQQSLANQGDNGRYYPPLDRLAPTMVGNTLRSTEARVYGRHHLNLGVVLPRLRPLLSEETRAELQRSERSLDRYLGLVAGGLLAIIGALVSGLLLTFLDRIVGGWAMTATLIACVYVAPVTLLSYGACLRAARRLSDTIEMTVDLERFKLLEQLRLPLPRDSDEERSLNENVSELLSDSAADTRPVVQYAHGPHPDHGLEESLSNVVATAVSETVQTAIHGPDPIYYEGYVRAVVDYTNRLTIAISTVPDANSGWERLKVAGSQRAASVSFTIVPDSATVRCHPEDQVVFANLDGQPSLAVFLLNEIAKAETHRLWVSIYQNQRLVHVSNVAATVQSDHDRGAGGS